MNVYAATQTAARLISSHDAVEDRGATTALSTKTSFSPELTSRPGERLVVQVVYTESIASATPVLVVDGFYGTPK